MAATPRIIPDYWGPTALNAHPSLSGDGPIFDAKFPGECAGCGQRFEVGDPVFYRAADELWAAHDCDPSTRDIPVHDNKIQVMPRGKSAADRCDRCFIVHASGQVDCE